MPDRTRPLLRRARPSAARIARLALVLAVLCAWAAAPAVAEPARTTTSGGFSVVASDAQIVAQSDDEPAGSGATEPGEPSAWNGVIGLLAWVVVAAVAFGFLLWVLFVRPGRRATGADDDDVPDREPGSTR